MVRHRGDATRLSVILREVAGVDPQAFGSEVTQPVFLPPLGRNARGEDLDFVEHLSELLETGHKRGASAAS